MVVFARPPYSKCCPNSNDCIYSFVCVTSGSASWDVDGDGDKDYCRGGTGIDSGEWWDCWDSGQDGCDTVPYLHGTRAAYCDGGSHDCVAKKDNCASCDENYECLGGSCTSGKCRTSTTESACSDGIDNDCDGDIDCADSDCAASCCGFEGNECCSGSSCDSGLYCDSGYCCATGWYWAVAECEEGEAECGLGGGSLCVSDISNFVNWYGDNDCYSQSSPFTGCCNVFQYNEWGYYDTSITTY